MALLRYVVAPTVFVAAIAQIAVGDENAIRPELAAGGEEYLDWGRQLFMTHCAPCHGSDARGRGPASASLKARPADLTKIAKRNGGSFPRLDVVHYIEGTRPVDAHGSDVMPVWGRVFRTHRSGSAGASPEIYALTDYLQSIQAK
jgi:mono/diheme cytochrome c family protein